MYSSATRLKLAMTAKSKIMSVCTITFPERGVLWAKYGLHNVYNPRSLVERKSEYRDTRVCEGATLGANCTIVCGTTVGKYAFMNGAVVNRDVKPYALMVGVQQSKLDG